MPVYGVSCNLVHLFPLLVKPPFLVFHVQPFLPVPAAWAWVTCVLVGVTWTPAQGEITDYTVNWCHCDLDECLKKVLTALQTNTTLPSCSAGECCCCCCFLSRFSILPRRAVLLPWFWSWVLVGVTSSSYLHGLRFST